MKIENHLESFKEHKETIFDWGIKIKGLKGSQRIIGTHASRAIVDLLAIYLLKGNWWIQGYRLIIDGLNQRRLWKNYQSLIIKNKLFQK